MKDLVLTIEQVKHLQELGLDMSDAKLRWYIFNDNHESRLITKNGINLIGVDGKYIPTYTLQEIWRKLPEYIIEDKSVYWKELTSNAVSYTDLDGNIHKTSCNDTEINNTYKMLCWIIENGYFKNK